MAGGSTALSSPTTANSLDKEDYDAFPDLQQLLTDSSNLALLPAYLDEVNKYKKTLDGELAQLITEYESQDGVQGLDHMAEELELLISQVLDTQKEAESTEEKILDMTRSIKGLDLAKKNLVQSMTVFKRLQMFISALERLKTSMQQKNYEETYQSLGALTELSQYFKPYRSVDQIAVVSKEVHTAQQDMVDAIFKDFEHTLESLRGSQYDSSVYTEMEKACRCLDLADESYKAKLTTWYCNQQLKEIRAIFRSSDEAGSLENVARRYVYMKKTLKLHDDLYAQLFPGEWEVGKALLLAFCDSTRDDIHSVLLAAGRSTEVSVLLRALQDTLEFEALLDKKFGSGEFGGKISSVFEPFLGIWIDSQDAQLQEMFRKFREDALKPPEDSGKSKSQVVPSSADLFYTYRQQLEQCAKLSKGNALVQLARLFAKWLDRYAEQILKRGYPERIQKTEDIATVCLVMNTADYCSTTIGQLEEKLQDIASESVKSQIDLGATKGVFVALVNQGFSLLLGKVEQDCEIAWREMVNSNWARIQQVGDQSNYVSGLRSSIEASCQTVFPFIQRDIYKRSFCDKIVEYVVAVFLKNVVKCRPINEIAAQQLLLDLYVLKTVFLTLPAIASPEESNQSSLYAKHVAKSMLKVETLLKILMTSISPSEGFVQNYFALIGDKSEKNFTKVLELKGVTRAKQNSVLSHFRELVKVHENLVDHSTLLDSIDIAVDTASASSFSLHLSRSSQVMSPSITPKRDSMDRHFENSANKINENLKHFGRLFRREGNNPPR